MAVAAAGAFREENVGARFLDEAVAEGFDGVTAAVFPPHGKGIHHFGGEERDDGGFKESVAGGEGQDVIAQAQRQSGGEDHNVEMAGVIGNQDKGGGVGQMLTASDFDVFGEFQNAVNPPPPEIAGDQAEQAAFADDRFAAGFALEVEVAGGLVFPVVHRRNIVGDEVTRLNLLKTDPDEV